MHAPFASARAGTLLASSLHLAAILACSSEDLSKPPAAEAGVGSDGGPCGAQCSGGAAESGGAPGSAGTGTSGGTGASSSTGGVSGAGGVSESGALGGGSAAGGARATGSGG